jgi:hypothetical protein
MKPWYSKYPTCTKPRNVMCHSVKHQTYISILLLWTLFVLSCSDNQFNYQSLSTDTTSNIMYDSDFGDSSLFRIAIAKSLEIPYNKSFDTVILKSKWKFICEMPDDFPDNYPETYIDKPPFIDTASATLHTTVITDSAFDKYMNIVLHKRFKGEYPESLFNTCLGDNIFVNVVTRKLRDQSYLVTADYRTVDTSVRVDRKFIKASGNWTYKEVNGYTVE